MAKKLYEESNMVEIGRAIQNKLGTSSSFTVPDMAYAILMISSHGLLQSLMCSENGMYMPEENYDGFSNVVVNVPESVPTVFGSKTISENGTYLAVEDGFDAYSKVTVTVESEGPSIKQIIEKTFSVYSNSYISMVRVECFLSCYELETIYLPSVVFLDEGAFAYCSKLSSIYLPNCQIIAGDAFEVCSSLTNIDLPECLSIGTGTFLENRSLEKVSIPKCEYIGTLAFANCSSLKELYLLSESVCELSEGSYQQYGPSTVFYDTPIVNSSFLGYYGSIYVLPSMVDVYKAHSCWSIYSERITAFIDTEEQNG